MKKYKQPILVKSIVLLTIIFAALLLLIMPNIFLKIDMIQWLFLAATIVILIKPKTQIELPKIGMPTYKWVTKIAILEIFIFGMFIGTYAILPLSSSVMTPSEIAQIGSTDALSIITHYGLSPWFAIAILTIAMRKHNDTSNKSTYVSECLPEFMRRYKIVYMITNITHKGAVMLAFSLFISITIIIASINVMTIHGRPQIPLNTIATQLTLAVLFVIISTKKISKALYYLVMHQWPTLLLFILFTVISTAIVVVTITITLPIKPDIPTILKQLQAYLLQDGWVTLWHTFLNYWWLLFIPISAPYFAKISEGRTYKKTIVAIIWLPLLLIAIFALLHHFNIPSLYFNNSKYFLVTTIIYIASFIGLSSILLKKNHLPILVFCSIPRLGRTKPRNLNAFIFNTLVYSILATLLFYTSSILVLNIIITSCIIIPFISYVAITYNIVTHKTLGS